MKTKAKDKTQPGAGAELSAQALFRAKVTAEDGAGSQRATLGGTRAEIAAQDGTGAEVLSRYLDKVKA